MAIIKKSARVGAVLFLLLGLVLSGCTPPGPRALLNGKKLLERGRAAEAVVELTRATSLLTTNAPAWNYLGLAYHQSGQATNAILAYQRALRLDHDLAEAHFNLGCLWLEKNRPDLARSEFTAFTALRGTSGEGWLKLAAAQFRMRDWTGAERSYQEALRMLPDSPEALNGLGCIQNERRKPREAAQYFIAALKQQPDYGPSLLNLAVVSHLHLKQPEFALERYREYVNLPVRGADWDAARLAMQTLENELAASRQPPVKAPAPAPVTAVVPEARPAAAPAAPSQTALAAHTDRGPRQAGETSRVTRPSPEPIAPVQPATRQPATPLERVVVSSGPVVTPAQGATAEKPRTDTAASAQGVHDDSTREKRGLLSHVNPANLFRRDTEPAVQAKIAAEAFPKGTRRYKYQNPRRPAEGDRAAAEKVFAAGWRAHQAGRLQDAVRSYREATRLDPGYFDAHFNLGIAASASDDDGTAMSAYEMALAIQPEAADARYNFAVLLKRAGYPVDCAVELEKILSSKPQDPRAHLLLGNLHAQSFGQPARARTHYETVLKVDPQNPQAAMIRYWLASQNP